MADIESKDFDDDEELQALRMAALATLKSPVTPNVGVSQESSYSSPINSIVTGPSNVGESDNSQMSFVQKSFSTHTWRKQSWPSRRGTSYSKSSQRSNLIVISPVSLEDEKNKQDGGKASSGKFTAAKLLPQFKWCGSGNEDSMSPKTLRKTGPTRFNRHGSDSESSDSDYSDDSESDSGSNETVLQDEPAEHFSRISPPRETNNVSNNPEKQRRLSFHNFESEMKSDAFDNNETVSVYNCLKVPSTPYNNRSDNYTAVRNQDAGVNVWDHSMQNNYSTYNQYSSQSYSTKPNSLSDFSRHLINSTHLSNGESHVGGTSFTHAATWQTGQLEAANSYFSPQGNTAVSNAQYCPMDSSYARIGDLSYAEDKKHELTQNDLRLELKKRMQEFNSKSENFGNSQSEQIVDEGHQHSSGENNSQTYSPQNDDNPSSYSYRNRRDRSYSRERYRSEHSSRIHERNLSQESEKKRSTSRDRTTSHSFETGHCRSRYEESFYNKRYRQEFNSRDKHEENSPSRERSRCDRRSSSRDRNRREHRSSSRGRSRREQRGSSRDIGREHRSSSRDRIRHEPRCSSRDRGRRERRSSSQDINRHLQRSSSQDKNRKDRSLSLEKGRKERSSSQSRNRNKPSSRDRSSNERSTSRDRSRRAYSSIQDRTIRDRSSSQSKGMRERSLSRNRSRRGRSSSQGRSSCERSSSRDRRRYERSSSGRIKRRDDSISIDRGQHEQNLNPVKVEPESSSIQNRTKYDNNSSLDKTKNDHINLFKSQKEESDNYEKSWSDCSAGREKTPFKRSLSRDRYQPSSYLNQQTIDYGSSAIVDNCISSQSKSKHAASQDKNEENCSKEKCAAQGLISIGKKTNLEQHGRLKLSQSKEAVQDRLADLKRSLETNRQRSKSKEKIRVCSRSPIQSSRSHGTSRYKRSRTRSSSRSSSSSCSSSSNYSKRPKIRSVPSVIKSAPLKSCITGEKETSTVVKPAAKISPSDIPSPSKRIFELGDRNKIFKSDRVDSDQKSNASDSNKRVPVHMRLGAFPRKRVLQMTKDVEAAFVNSSSSSDNESVSTKCKRQSIRIASDISVSKSGTDSDRKPALGSEKSDKADNAFREKSRRLKTYR